MNSLYAKAESCRPMVLSILRIVAGLLFFEHGLSKLTGWPQPGHMPEFMTLIWFAGCIETIGGALVAVGLFTRIAAVIMSGEMAFAYFMAHNPKSVFPIINGGDAPILFCFVFLYIACAGPGPWSLDAMMGKKQ
ncbi:MAG TPA: DoxX family protein [Xanthobacteraceae bacterium]|jgi:putative oxidoreductase|nr:DoxX family protein [Xanthobacteraceae bacterium]